MSTTTIEWTQAVWNPTKGCDRVSPGCDHCYALTMAKRLKGMGQAEYQQDGDPRTSGPGFLAHESLNDLGWPLRRKKPLRIFVNSMSDLFHANISDEFIARVFAVMALAPQHDFQLLTKRHARMRALLSQESFPELVTTWAWRIDAGRARRLPRGESNYSHSAVAWPLPNVWLGVSVESQQWADIRIPALLDTPAAVRFLSCEPLLGPVDLYMPTPDEKSHPDIDWVIAGGESGPGARPMHPDWARALRDQCIAARVPFLFKQWGEWAPTRMLGMGVSGDPREICVPTSLNPKARPMEGEWIRRVGKKAAGRELDGRTWDEYPAVAR